MRCKALVLRVPLLSSSRSKAYSVAVRSAANLFCEIRPISQSNPPTAGAELVHGDFAAPSEPLGQPHVRPHDSAAHAPHEGIRCSGVCLIDIRKPTLGGLCCSLDRR